MIKKLLFMLLFGVMVFAPFGQKAQAYSPYLSANWEGNNNVRINVNSGQSYTSIDVYYKTVDSQMWSVVTNIGSTDGSGYYSGLVDLGITSWSGVSLYAKVGYDQTSTVNLGYGGGSGCWGANCNVGGMTFSENNVSLVTGQSRTVNVYAPYLYSGSYYVSSNSNSSAVSASLSGSTLNLYGNYAGSATIVVCQTNTSSNCGTLYATVNGGSSYGNITFSQTNPTMNVGQSQSISIYGSNYYNNNYYISSNSNSGVVSASVSGSTLNLYSNYAGNASIVVCQTGYSSSCGTLYVTVGGGSSYGNITFSDANPYLTVGQSKYVSIYNSGSGSGYYISSNSNSSAISASISGNSIYLYANYAGSATIIICRSGYSSSCGTIYATTSGSGGSSNVYLNPSSVTVNVGQTATAYAGLSSVSSGNLYLSSNSNFNVATASFSGSTIYIYGQNPGSTTMNVCYSSGGQCAYLYVTVSGYCTGWNCNNNNNTFNFVSTTLPQPTVGQYYSQQMQVTSGAGVVTYTLQSGTLPTGLYLSTTGQIYGTPTSNSPTYFTVRASDSYGKSAVQSFSLTPTSSSNVLGSLLYSNGTLIKENNTVYITYKNMKTGFTNRSAFEGLGFKFGNVNYVTSSGLLDSGYNVWTSASSHPWGSWIKSGNTVYFVHESGLIPVSNYDVFLNNGGQDYLVVRSNYYDFQLPMLAVMEYSDSRLR